MAEKYVDLNATGANNGLTLVDAWTTLASAESGADALDRINVSAGNYLEASFTCNKELTWLATGVVTLQGSSTSWLLISQTSVLQTLDGFVFDGELLKTPSILRLNTAGNNIVFKNSEVKNPEPSSSLYSTANTTTVNVTFDNMVFNGTSSAVMFNLIENSQFNCLNSNLSGNYNGIGNAQNSADYKFNGNTVNITLNGTTPLWSCKNITGSVEMNGNAVTLSSSTAFSKMFRADSCENVSISNNVIDSRNATENHSSVLVEATLVGVYPNAVVDNNDIDNDSLSGAVVLVGTDTPTGGTPDALEGAVISNQTVRCNSASGGIHGIELGYNKGLVKTSKVYDAGYGIVIKGTQDFLGVGGAVANLLFNSNNVVSIHCKGTKNVPVVNNSIYANNGAIPVSGYIYSKINEQSSDTPATGTKIHNQIIMATGNADVGNMVNIDLTSIPNAEIDGNLYYAPNASLRFVYGGNSYSDLASWNAAISGTDFEGDPMFVDPENGNFELQAGSAAIGIGVKYWGNKPRPSGNNGEPVPDVQIDSGMNQSLHSINHPGNPNFVPLGA